MNSELQERLRAPLGVIDVGAHTARLEIVQVDGDGGLEILENVEHPLPLGRDVFSSGKIGLDNMRLAIRVMRDFARLMGEYGVRDYTAVATSAVRESLNREIFIHRIRQESEIELDVLEGPAEVRLIFLAVEQALRDRFPLSRGNSVIYTMGTGSSQLCFCQDGYVQHADTIRLGTLRLVEEQLNQRLSPQRLNEIVDPFVAEVLSGAARVSPAARPDRLIAVGAPVRALIGIDHRHMPQKVGTLTRNRFQAISDEIAARPVSELVDAYGVPDIVANSLEPCCHMLAHLFEITDAARMEAPMINTRDAIIDDMLRRIKGEPDPFVPHIVSAARALGERYRHDSAHADHVVRNALILFDELRDLHRLDDNWRMLLHVAGIVHDIGLFISGRGHHKHSYYLVRNSPLPGISAHNQELLAAIVRYHRKSAPKPTHREYAQLSTDEQVAVSKAAALLRVADALDRSHQGRVRRLRVELEGDRLVLRVQAPHDLTFEQWGLPRKADLFEEVFGYRVALVRQG